MTRQPIPVLINGQSEKSLGLLLASQAKGWQWAGITLAVALGLFLIGLIAYGRRDAAAPRRQQLEPC